MNGPPESHDGPEGQRGAAQTPPATTARRHRRLRVIAGAVALILGLMAAFLIIAPRHIARYVANHYLTGMQIDVEGVKTIDIDLFNGEFSIGPVRFHSGTADPGTIGLLGVKLSLSNLIHRQALLSAVVLNDVDLSIRQTPDGEILVNGISLRQMMAEQTEQEQQPQPPADTDKKGWDAGIDDLSVRNTHVRFTNRAGGTAAVTINRLDLRGFRTWELDHPGTFVLTGDVNGAEVKVYGRAQPFGESINVFSELTVNGVDLTGIEEFTGPLPLKPSAGTATAYARNTIDLAPDGHLSGSTTVTLVLSNIDVTDPKMGTVTLDQAATDVDVRFTLDPDGAASGAGRVQAKLNQGNSALADGTSLTLPFLTLDLSELTFNRTAAGTIDATTQTRLQVDTPQLGGPADVSAEQVLLTVPRINAQMTAEGTTSIRLSSDKDNAAKPRLEVASPNVAAPVRAAGQKLVLDLDGVSLQLNPDGTAAATAGAGLAVERGTLAIADPRGRETMALELATLTATVTNLSATMADGAITASGKAGAGIDGLVAFLAGEGASGSQRLAADTLRLNLEPVSVATQRNGSTLATSGVLQLAGLSAALPAVGDQPGVQVGSRDAELNFRDIQLKSDTAAGMQVAGTLNAALRGLAGTWGTASTAPHAVATRPASGARAGRGRTAARQAAPPAPPSAGGRIAAEQLTLGLSPLTLNVRGDELTGRLSATTELRKVDARVPVARGESPFDITLAGLRVGLADASVSMRGADADLTGTLQTSLETLNAVQPTRGGSASRAGERLRTALESLRLTLSPLDVKTRGDRLSVSTNGMTEVQSFAQELPRSQQKPAAQATVDSLRANLTDITAEMAPADLRWQARLDAQANRLVVLTEGGKAASLSLNTVSIGDLGANERQQVNIGRVVLDRLQGFFTRDYIQGSAAAPESRPKQIAQAVESAAQEGWKVRIGSLGITDDSAIRVRDTSVEPNANFTIAIKTLQVQNVDMIDPTQHMQVRLDASINEFTELAVAGWAAPFMGKPDFDLNARLHRLELPPLSPYAAPAIGVNVESGRLSVDATAAAKSGNLNGDLVVTLRNLNFSTLSAADAQRLSAAVGVPIETIVGLLQDDQGRIRLNLPVAGDLSSPSFDPSDAIRQALTGALQAAVLVPFQLAFAPVALIAKAAGGGPMTFQPIPFVPGESKLESEGRDIVAGLARVLKEREKLRINVCGQATAADLHALADGALPPPGPAREARVEELRPKLQELAAERTAAVRRLLINDGDVKPRQVAECRSTFNPSDQKPPRADVGL